MRVAIVYDRVNKWGGAERVLLALHELYPDAPLYTSVYQPKRASWAKVFQVFPSFLQHVPFAKHFHEFFALLMPIAFESFSFEEFDVVISVTSEAAKGIITSPKTTHICYCLTPTRYLWSGYDEYFRNRVFRLLAKPAIFYLRFWDKIAAFRPDGMIAISHEVQERIKIYYKKDALLVYPPITLSTDETKKIPAIKNSAGYFLVVSRLVGYKRIDLAIRACAKLQIPLKIIGRGVESSNLKQLAKTQRANVEFLTSLTDEELVGYYKGCLALLFPGKEDLGLTIVEAQRFGKPVIAYKSGGALEIIKERKTGEFFSPQTAHALYEKLKKFRKKKYRAKDCREQAERFSKEKFKQDFVDSVAQIVQERGKLL